MKEGKIRGYGWSTDTSESVKVFGEGTHCLATQIMLNIFGGNTDIVGYAEERDLAVLCRSPLAMGLLSDKYDADTTLRGDDIRATDTEWLAWFKDGKPGPDFLRRRDAAREILRSRGRSTVQGALAWLWGKSTVVIPIPGFKNTAQALENAGAIEKGPLSADQVKEVENLVGFQGE